MRILKILMSIALKMKMKTINIYLYIIMCVLLSACTGGKQNSFSLSGGDTLKLKYAQNITIVKHEGFTEVTLADPWNEGKSLAKYLLSDNPDAIDAAAKQGCTVVKTPLKKALLSTSVHCALYDEMGAQGVIAGVCDPDYIGLDFVKNGVESKKIADCGSSMQPNLERVIALSPDAIMLSPYQGSTGYGKISEIGVPIIELADYMETSPLGRAEWMLFFGMLAGEEDKAAELFADVEKSYNEYKQIAAEQSSKKSVLMDKMVQATWFVPGGNSTIGQMLRDANCIYAYADTKQSGSIEQSFEQILDKCAEADLWLVRYNKEGNDSYNLASLAKENEKYKVFKAYKDGNVYGCEPTDSHFFEDTPFHPERLLRDFVLILHPECKMAKTEKPKYFKKL